MKKVIIVAYSFPPVGGAGVQRPVKFVKNLRHFGWEPVVLTAANPSVPVTDQSLLKDIPAGVKVFKARTFEPSYETKKQVSLQGGNVKGRIKKMASRLLLPDVQVLWWPAMVCKLFMLLFTEKPDCLFVTAPPFSSFIPVVVAGRIFRVPVVIDFRDEWSFSRMQWEHAVKTPLAFLVDSVLERFALSQCSQFVAANASYVNSLKVKYPAICKGKGEVVTNGFDEDDFAGLTRSVAVSGKVTFVYAGTVWNATSLASFTAAVRRMLAEQPGLAKLCVIKIYGRVVGSHMDYLTDPVLNGMIEVHGYMDHGAVIQQMCNCDVLLMTLADLPGAHKIIAGKVFEYMYAKKHIFAVLPHGELRNILLENYNKVTLADFGNGEEIYRGLLWIMTNLEQVRNAIPSNVDHFSRECLTGKLVSVFDAALSGKPSL